MTNGAKQEGPKRCFYKLWDQNVNWKLIKGPKDQLSRAFKFSFKIYKGIAYLF